MKYSLLIATTVVAAVTACSGSDASEQGNPPGADGSAAGSEGAPVSGQERAAEDVETLREYELDMDKLEHVFAAQMNLVKAIAALSPEERAEMEAASTTSPTDGLAEVVAKLDANPVARKAVTDAGISTREYITASMAMMQASMAHSVIQSRPADNGDSLARMMDTNPKNVQFVRENMAELTRRQNEMAAEMSRMGIVNGS